MKQKELQSKEHVLKETLNELKSEAGLTEIQRSRNHHSILITQNEQLLLGQTVESDFSLLNTRTY